MIVILRRLFKLLVKGSYFSKSEIVSNSLWRSERTYKSHTDLKDNTITGSMFIDELLLLNMRKYIDSLSK